MVINFYTAEDVTTAKACLLSAYSCLVGTSHATGRRGSSARPHHEAEVDDIIAGLDFIDNKDALGSHQFVAVNLENLPKYGPEKINICTVVDRQVISDRMLKPCQIELMLWKYLLTV